MMVLAAASFARNEPPLKRPLTAGLRVRLNTVRHAADMLRLVVPEDPLGRSIHDAGVALEEKLREIAGLPAGGPYPPTEPIREQIASIERAFLALDATVPMILFRQRVDAALFPTPVVVGYLSLLARHLGDEAERRDRIDFLVTALCSRERDEGHRIMRPRGEVSEVLDRVSTGIRATPELRERAMRFFERARWAAARVRKPEAVFESGLFQNAYGFKLSLGRDFLDPKILYASAELNITLGNLFAGHKKACTAAAGEARVRTREVLGESSQREEVARMGRFERHRLLGQKLMATRRRPLSAVYPGSRASWKPAMKMVATLALTLGLGWISFGAGSAQPHHALPESALQRISPLLREGQVRRDAEAALLDAVIDQAAWEQASRNERVLAAAEMAAALREVLALEHAVIRGEDGALQVLIQGGRVMTVH